MFSTSTQSSAIPPHPSTSKTRVGSERDVRMQDAGTAGGRKGSSRIKAHRLRGSGIDLYKSDNHGAKTSLAARINSVDPDGTRGAGVSIRGASTSAGRSRRPPATATVLREAIGTPLTSNVVDMWRDFVNRRYDRTNKFLNLESMADDEILKANNITVPGQPGATYREGGAIFKLASKLEPEVQSISLASNRIKYLTHFSTINMYLPKLANLSLQNNLIDDFTELDKIAGRGTKVSLLREVILVGNPMREKEVQKGNLQHYSSEVRRRFPMLEMLDQQPLMKIEFDISGEVSRFGKASKALVRNYPLTFPLPMGGNGMAPDNQMIVGQFLTKFFTCFDNDRTSLLPAYAPNALFSYSANTAIPTRARIEGHHTSKDMPNQTKLEWKQWLEKSRNLSRVGRSLEKAAKTLFANSNDIVAFVQNLPKTQHDLQGAADKFSLDAWPVDSVLQGGQPVLFLSVHGQFAEAPSMGVRSFDRSFMVAAAPEGSQTKLAGWDVVILSDLLTIRNFSSPQAWTPGPLKVTHDARQMEALALSEPQRSLVLQLSARTNLTYAYAAQCLSENNWDAERAVANFEQVKAQLGSEAFNRP